MACIVAFRSPVVWPAVSPTMSPGAAQREGGLAAVLGCGEDLHPAIEQDEHVRRRIALDAEGGARRILLVPAERPQDALLIAGQQIPESTVAVAHVPTMSHQRAAGNCPGCGRSQTQRDDHGPDQEAAAREIGPGVRELHAVPGQPGGPEQQVGSVPGPLGGIGDRPAAPSAIAPAGQAAPRSPSAAR